MDHPQPTTPLQTNNSTAEVTIIRKNSKNLPKPWTRSFIGLAIRRTKNTFNFIGHPSCETLMAITQKKSMWRIITPYGIFIYIEKQIKSNSRESIKGVLI